MTGTVIPHGGNCSSGCLASSSIMEEHLLWMPGIVIYHGGNCSSGCLTPSSSMGGTFALDDLHRHLPWRKLLLRMPGTVTFLEEVATLDTWHRHLSLRKLLFWMLGTVTFHRCLAPSHSIKETAAYKILLATQYSTCKMLMAYQVKSVSKVNPS